MPSPQVENGFVRIASEIIDALVSYRVPGEQMQCLLFIIRKTYGYAKKEDMISNSQFCKATGLKSPNVSRAITGLVNKKIVIKKDNGKVPIYQFNKHYNQWASLSKKITVIKKDNSLLSKKIPTIDIITKDINTHTYKGEVFDPIEYRPERVPVGHWTDFLENRKKKKLQNTEMALKKILSSFEEAEQHGYKITDCIEEYVSCNMQRFHFTWMEKSRGNNGKTGNSNRRIGPTEPGKHGKTDWLS